MSLAFSTPVLPTIAAQFEFGIAQTGLYLGKAAYLLKILGRRQLGWNSNSVLGDVAQYLDTTQDLINTPATGTTYYIVSTSASDTAAGTGARTVRIVYLDASGNQQVTTATMNGTTAVSLGSGFLFFQWMEVASTGSAETTVGNISITSINGAATVATTMEYIRAGGNKSLSGRYRVPTGYTGFLGLRSAYAINGDMDTRLRGTVFTNDRTLSTVFHFIDNIYAALNTGSTKHLGYLSVPAGCVLKISAIPSATAAANRCDASLQIILIAN